MATEGYNSFYKCYICKSAYNHINVGPNRPRQCTDCFTFNLPFTEVSDTGATRSI